MSLADPTTLSGIANHPRDTGFPNVISAEATEFYYGDASVGIFIFFVVDQADIWRGSG
jgi:hypothetical protein